MCVRMRVRDTPLGHSYVPESFQRFLRGSKVDRLQTYTKFQREGERVREERRGDRAGGAPHRLATDARYEGGICNSEAYTRFD